MSPVHPYYPLGLVIPNWLPQTVAMEKILFRFFVTLTVLFIGFALVYRRRPESKTTFSSPPFFLAAWFFLCGVIHTFVEGYFVATHATIAGDDTFLANLWKEYGKSDSRYMVSDPTVLLIEAITAILWGPLSFYTAYACLKNTPGRHLLQFLISTGQLYGDILYYSTTLLEGAPHCHPHPFYFWFYFVFMNALWIVFPLAIMITSGRAIYVALEGAYAAGAIKGAAAKKTRVATPRKKAN